MAHVPISDNAAKEFGRLIARLIELRKADAERSGGDYTQRDLAKAAEVSPQLITQIIQGHIPAPDIIRRLAKELRIRYYELWIAAFKELLPDGYDLMPFTNGNGPPSVEEPLAALLENAAATRLLHSMAAMDPERLRLAIEAQEELYRG